MRVSDDDVEKTVRVDIEQTHAVIAAGLRSQWDTAEDIAGEAVVDFATVEKLHSSAIGAICIVDNVHDLRVPDIADCVKQDVHEPLLPDADVDGPFPVVSRLVALRPMLMHAV